MDEAPAATLQHPADIWAVFAVQPDSVEFWQGRSDRQHIRLRYARIGASWAQARLHP